MKPIWKILAACCLCISFAGSVTAYADVEVSPRVVAPVRATGDYSNIAVSQVSDYVNIREQANTDSAIVGKIYNNCAATILETVQGEGGDWYRIQSGTVNGYIKAQYFITGEAAEKVAQAIGREFVTINTEGLRLREQPDLTSNILTHLSNGARYVVQGEEGDFFKVEVDADLVGFIAKEYCKTEVEFDQAVSLEEERQKLAEEAQRRQDAQDAMEALQQVIMVEANQAAESGTETGAAAGGAPTLGELIIAANPLGSDTSHNTTAPKIESGSQSGSGSSQGGQTGNGGTATIVAANPNGAGQPSSGQTAPAPSSAALVSATRTAIVAYAKQFLGNPYVYGGTSLTNGTDCSGFTQGVYAHFGITTGRTSRDQAANGREIAVSAVQPGDLLFYASGNYINHVAMYIGDGKVIHSSTPTTGITIAPYDYRTPCKAVCFLN